MHRVRATRRDRLSLPSMSLSASAIARDPRPLGRHLLTPSPIITALPRCPDAENTDRYLSEVEMKLQLLAEDISLALEEQSLAGLQRIPRAVAEIDRVEHDTKGLQTRIQGILRRLDDAEGASRESVRLLTSVDKVKGRMESARETLRNAAGLAELVAGVDDVFAAGNIRHMADVLSSMRRGLKVVGGVPEFQDAPEKLEELERRIEALARPELVAALAADDAVRAEEMRDVLKVSGRVSALVSAYAETRVVTPLLREWNTFDDAAPVSASANANSSSASEAARFAEWLPNYATSVAARLEREAMWASSTFPEEAGELVSTAWRRLSERTRREFSARMATNRLDLFASAYDAAGDGFSRAARATAEVSGVSLAAEALGAALAPFDAVCARYGELEAKTLAERVPRVEVTRADDVELAAAEMAATVARAAETLAEPLDRCVALTAGTEAAAMLGAVDDALAKYAKSLLAAMRRVRRARGMPGDGDGEDGGFATAEVSGTSPAGEESIQAAFGLVSVAAALTSACETLERGFVRALRELRDALDPALPRAARPDDVNPAPLPEPASAEALTPALAAVHSDPDRARRLRALLDRAARDPGFRALPSGTARVSAFSDASRAFVLDALLSKVRGEFEGVSRRREWNKKATDSEFQLPTFSAYPQEYMTNAGEYLLSLPQHLEAIAEAKEEAKEEARNAEADAEAGDDDAKTSTPDEPDIEAGEWMADVAEAACGLLLGEVRRVRALSEPGAAQLAADIEYFINVVAALSLEPPRALVAYGACCAASRDSYAILSGDDEGMDRDVVRAVAAMRGISLGE